MGEYSIRQAKVTGGFWAERSLLNAQTAIFHQWEQLEASQCIDNFRIAAGLKKGFREGFFFADSDAYKWLDAASRILIYDPSPRLCSLINEFIAILEKAQEDDGYLYTYNQIHFGAVRWQSLQIEHEFYCLGHLIEAGIWHHCATGEESLFTIARKAANLLVDRFWDESPVYTDGHEEIEIALIHLSRHTGISRYRELAKRFLQRRGRITSYWLRIIWQTLASAARMNTVKALRKKYYQSHPAASGFELPAHNKHIVPWSTPLRFAASALSGKYTQQHLPVDKIFEPVGHAVRFTYLNAAAAMLALDEHDDSDLPRLELIWEHMVNQRMYVTGGIGSLPLIEGFGRDYELDPEVAYNETCAALGSMLWDREMVLLTGDARYDDLFEWQLYNAALVGIGLDGCSYFYNNPLKTQAHYKREGWYDIPCCPSNLSREWANIADHAVSVHEDEIRVHQYIGCDVNLYVGQSVSLHIESGLPWGGNIRLNLQMEKPARFTLSLRRPTWAGECTTYVNGQVIHPVIDGMKNRQKAACGLNFNQSGWMRIDREFHNGDKIEAQFSMPICILDQDSRIPKCGGNVALSRGPVLYCLESIDNSVDIMHQTLGSGALNVTSDANILEGVPIIKGSNPSGESLTFIPYALWGNRGNSTMTVFLG
jgi:DUF1680 family protein